MAMERGWTGRPCPKCKGTGETEEAYGRRACQGCGGTGEEYGDIPTKEGEKACH